MGPQYTSCVEEAKFADLNWAYLGTMGFFAAAGAFIGVFTFGVGFLISAAAFFEALRYVLDWLVNGKLICLHRDPNAVDCACGLPEVSTVCAIGEIADTEHVGEDKNPIQDIDDDYSINLALFPFNMGAFAAIDYVKPDAGGFNAHRQAVMAIATAPGQVQGDLLRRSISKHGKADEFGYLRTMVIHKANGQYFPGNEILGRDAGTPFTGPDADENWMDYLVENAWQGAAKFSLPVLHCEFEGSRTSDMLDTLEGFPFGKSFCKSNWFTKLLCKVVAAVFAPILLIQLARAWAGNTEGSVDPALVGGGTIGPKNRVIVRGSWVYDAGHEGYNEVHAVRIVQRVEAVPSGADEFKDFLARWCARLSEVRPVEETGTTGSVGQPLDRRPEDEWEHHPEVDGCSPEAEPEPNEPVIG